jgi:hypothetical protein
LGKRLVVIGVNDDDVCVCVVTAFHHAIAAITIPIELAQANDDRPQRRIRSEYSQ